MSAAPDARRPEEAAARLRWLPVLAGLLLLYAPIFYSLATWLWQQEDNAHGPIIFAIFIWLIWRQRAALFAVPARAAPIPGFALLIAGLVVYVLGYSHDIVLFTVGALAPILAGATLAMCGWQALRALWFPILFIVFMVPLPGIFVDALTGPLKQHVSEITARILYAAGYPVGQAGVVITIGQYQLLVADACSGLNSMFSLSALGALFIYVNARASVLHNAVILAAVLPVAFAANVVRVLMLILITYHFGDAAGQGFLHGAAGIVLLLVALAILIFLDAILVRIIKPPRPEAAA